MTGDTFGHRLWESGVPAPSATANASSDEELFVAELLEQLRDGATPSGRKSSALVAGILFRATEARLRTFASLGAHLSELERQSLAQLLMLPAEERRMMAALLRLPDPERDELAVVLQLADAENEALAAFVDDREAASPSATPTGRPRDHGTRKGAARRMSG